MIALMTGHPTATADVERITLSIPSGDSPVVISMTLHQALALFRCMGNAMDQHLVLPAPKLATVLPFKRKRPASRKADR